MYCRRLVRPLLPHYCCIVQCLVLGKHDPMIMGIVTTQLNYQEYLVTDGRRENCTLYFCFSKKQQNIYCPSLLTFCDTQELFSMILDDYILMSYTFRLVGVTFKHSLDSGHCKTAPHFHCPPPRMCGTTTEAWEMEIIDKQVHGESLCRVSPSAELL